MSSEKTPTLKPEVVTAKIKEKSIHSGDIIDNKHIPTNSTNAWNIVDQSTEKKDDKEKKKKKRKKKKNKTQPSPMLNSAPILNSASILNSAPILNSARIEPVNQPVKIEEKLKVDIDEDSEIVDTSLAKSMLEKLGIDSVPPPNDNIKTIPQNIWDPKIDLLQPETQKQKSLFDDILETPSEKNITQNGYEIPSYTKVDVNNSPNVNDLPQNLPPILDINSALDNPFVFQTRRTTSRFHFAQQESRQQQQQLPPNQFQQQLFTPPFMGQMNNMPFNPYIQQPPRQSVDEELQQSFRALLPNVKIKFTSEHDQPEFQKPSNNQPNLGSSRQDSQNININNNINNININISNHNFNNSVHNFDFRNVTNNSHTNYNGYNMGYPHHQFPQHQQFTQGQSFGQNHQPYTQSFTQPMYSGAMDIYKDMPPMHYTTHQTSKFLHIIQQQVI